MAVPIAYRTVQTAKGIIDIPIYSVFDVADSSYRVNTHKGVGCYDLIEPTIGTPLRVMTKNGVKGVNMVIAPSKMQVRYIRDWCGDSNWDNERNWCEIQAIDINGNNVALNKASSFSPGYTVANVASLNNGIITTFNPTTILGQNPAIATYAQIDLGQDFSLKEITVHHWLDSSVFFQLTKTEVSADGTNWIVLFDSAISGIYVESAKGKTHVIG